VSAIKLQAESLAATKDGQITDRYARAIEQLGAAQDDKHPKVEVRVGAIYALERIARESKTDYWPIMQILTTYVWQVSQSDHPPDRPRADVQAALTVIGQRNSRWDNIEGEHLRLIYANLPNAWLPSLDFRNFYIAQANLSGAYLMGAHLENADLKGAHLNGAHLHNAHLNNADLEGADLTSADLTGADLRGVQHLPNTSLLRTITNSETRPPNSK
jgi:hypothetical protein